MAALGEMMSMPAAAAAFEVLSVVWTEAALFGCAAIAYLAFSGSQAFTGKYQIKKVFTKVNSGTVKNREVPTKISKPKGTYAGSQKSRACSIPSDPAELRALVKDTPAPLSKALAKAILGACVASKDVELTADVFEKVASADAAELRVFAEGAATRLAKGAAQHAADTNAYSGKDPTVKARSIRMLGRAGDLEAAIALFEESLPTYEAGSNARGKAATLLFNGIIDACAECKDLNRASSYLARARALELADAVSFNTLMKGYLAAGDEDTAQKLLQELPTIAGCQATQASFHGLMNARVAAGDARGAWRCLADMQAAGVTPNTVSCAILLKGVATPKDAADIHRVLELIEGQGQPIDEVLLSSMVDACLRSGELHFLARFMEQRRSRGETVVLSAPAYGSLIKAYGQAHDVKNVWAMWHEMLERDVQPSQITLGCMVEALVTNRCAEEAWRLVQEMWGDEANASLVNTISVSTLLKGFARQPERVMAIYEEMRARKIQSNVITYNTILNAFAEGGAMCRAPALLEDMKVADPPVEPDVVTYSTLIKGFCSDGDLDRALGLLEQMKQDGKYVPDEMMYNSLLDGCAKEQRVKDALKLIADMRVSGVAPSNYTLTMLVKLLGRCRMLNQAFSIVEDLKKEYSIRPNIQVYTCLIQACFQNRQHGKAVSLLDRLMAEGIRPDEKTYTALVRGCVQARQVDQAVKMVRRAYQDASPPAGVDSKILDDVIRKLGTGSEAAESLLADVRRQKAAGAQVHGRRKPQNSEKPSSRQVPSNAPWRCSDRSASGSGSDVNSDTH